MVAIIAVWAVASWALLSGGCEALDNCPPSFGGLCSCGMGYSRYDNFQKEKFTVNCTNTGFTNASMLRDLPVQTEVLIFNGNTVPELPFNVFSNFNNFDDLETIDMSNNHLRFIQGKTFHKVYNVKNLILDHNDLEITDKRERPRVFSNFENLERLHLTNAFSEKINSSDYLLSLEDIFYESDLIYLKILHLEQNEIWSIGNNAKVFCQLEYLEQVLLGDNRLIDFDFRIDCLHSLRYIDLERNMIPRLSDRAMADLDSFMKSKTAGYLHVKLAENPFVCDCRSKNFLNWLNTTSVQVIDWEKYRCIDGYPESNIGKLLNEVHELDCPASSSKIKTNSRNSESFHDDHVNIIHHHSGYSSSTIGALSFFLVFTSSMLLAIAYFHKQKIMDLVVPYWDFITRKIGYTGISNDETPQELVKNGLGDMKNATKDEKPEKIPIKS
ncbi:trophoblast glycoprotein isoform X2 [Procambarus clarkii]|uniref:trophoblast glycoprotein isoform X2 n=1 Tax=Procambarus clarkii TaxID=6728 RepID=UPI001E673A9B|nr:SLIT and NTRK-like protein 2 isoform X2 [Procambarus clarkii]